MTSIDVIDIKELDEEIFRAQTASARKPLIFRGVDIGPCAKKWNGDYLTKALGDTEVKIHVCPVAQLDFINKNFAYKTLKLSEYIKRTYRSDHEPLEDYFIHPHEQYYLRSLGDDVRKDVADIQKQFPQIANDIIIPRVFTEHQFFSSVFRIASPGCQLWTHYDVMDNLLVQAVGHKKVVLYAPTDLPFLYLRGDKSAVLDPDQPDLDTYPLFVKATPYRAVLQPGDILYIPAFWFHNVIALDFSVAVNVFWKNLDDTFYDSKDVYGNKDLTPAARAQQGVEKAIKTLNTLPDDCKDFYILKIIDRLKNSLTCDVYSIDT